jgi:hypothetical protein
LSERPTSVRRACARPVCGGAYAILPKVRSRDTTTTTWRMTTAENRFPLFGIMRWPMPAAGWRQCDGILWTD